MLVFELVLVFVFVFVFEFVLVFMFVFVFVVLFVFVFVFELVFVFVFVFVFEYMFSSFVAIYTLFVFAKYVKQKRVSLSTSNLIPNYTLRLVGLWRLILCVSVVPSVW